MGKRSQPVQPSRAAAAAPAGKQAKRTKLQDPPVATIPTPVRVVTDPYMLECTEITSFIDSATTLNESCRSMLKGALPDCLRGDPLKRHHFQKQMAQVWGSVLQGITNERLAQIDEAETKIDEIEAGKKKAAEELAKADGVVAHTRAQDEKAKAGLQEAISELNSARSALHMEQQRERAAKKEFEDACKEKAHLEQVFNQKWKPLMDGALPCRDSRERIRCIDTVIQALTGTGCDESLVAAVLPALKMKVADRGPFSVQTLKHAQAALEARIATLATKTEPTESTESGESLAAANEAMTAASSRLDASAVALSSVQDCTVAAEFHRQEAAAVVDEHQKQILILGAALKQKQERVAEAEGMFARFCALAGVPNSTQTPDNEFAKDKWLMSAAKQPEGDDAVKNDAVMPSVPQREDAKAANDNALSPATQQQEEAKAGDDIVLSPAVTQGEAARTGDDGVVLPAVERETGAESQNLKILMPTAQEEGSICS